MLPDTRTEYAPGERLPTTKAPATLVVPEAVDDTMTHVDVLVLMPVPEPPPTEHEVSGLVVDVSDMDPEKLTSVPEGPEDGFNESTFVPTMNMVEAESPPGAPVPITVYDPLNAPLLIVFVVVQAPFTTGPHEGVLVKSPLGLLEKVTVSPVANPVVVRATAVKVGPAPGDIVILGVNAVTINTALAKSCVPVTVTVYVPGGSTINRETDTT